MALLTTRDFETGTIGDTISNGTFHGYTVTGTAPATVSSNAFEGTRALEINATSNALRTFRFDHTPSTLTWDTFTFEIVDEPGTTLTIWQGWGEDSGSAATLIASAQCTADRRIRLRNISSLITNGESGVLAPGTYQIAIKCDPGSGTGLRLKVYDASGNLVHDSGDRASTVADVTQKSWSTLGHMVSTTGREVFDWHRIDDATEPAPVVVSAPVASAGADTTVDSFSTLTLAGGASGGSGSGYTYDWSQVDGPTAGISLTGSGSSRTLTVSGYVADTALTFRLVVTDSADAESDPDDVVVTVRRHPRRIRVAGEWKVRRRHYRVAGAWVAE